MSRTLHVTARTETRAIALPRGRGAARVNLQGKTLARELAPHIGTSDAITLTCSEIACHANVIQAFEVNACNRPVTKPEIAHAARAWIALHALVRDLPHAAHGPLVAVSGDDPRGHVVRVKVPGVPHLGNTWGLGGEFGVGEWSGRD